MSAVYALLLRERNGSPISDDEPTLAIIEEVLGRVRGSHSKKVVRRNETNSSLESRRQDDPLVDDRRTCRPASIVSKCGDLPTAASLNSGPSVMCVKFSKLVMVSRLGSGR